MHNACNCNNQRVPFKGFAIDNKDGKFHEWEHSRHAMGEYDVVIDTHFSGICHTDIHFAHSDWLPGIYPMVPGHEIAGVVSAVGSKVTKFKVGDHAGVGCMVNSCGECHTCKHEHQEQWCENNKTIYTYSWEDSFHNNEPTYGGYSNNIVVSENFVISIPKEAPLDKAAPLLCAGITVYSPLKFSKVAKGSKVGIAGFGGLGHMALKYAVAMGAQVSVFARNDKKKQMAQKLGATNFYTSVEECKEKFDLIISSIPTQYDLLAYTKLLKYGGEVAVVGIPPKDPQRNLDFGDLVLFSGNHKVYGSWIGGVKETQEMMDFSVKHGIYPEIELVTGQEIDATWDKLLNGQGNFRYVIDMKKSMENFKK
ncbi:NAD(P)-dependent alcohol dehydrogenase [Helicobacter pylori]|nr:NAD(P)-dependent alcohol dehydrogenase [Helicobacter pylori]